jgi:cobalt-zinc-cadmium efflux system outer membrane protein
MEQTMRYYSWVFLLVIVVSVPAEPQTLTEASYLKDALENHAGLVVAQADVDSAVAARRKAGLWTNPQFGWEREDPDLAAQQDTWTLSWKLPFDGRRHRVTAADEAVAAARSDFEGQRLVSRLELKQLFAEWVIAHERSEVLSVAVERVRQLATRLRDQATEGEKAGVEASRIELELEVLERDLALARAETTARKSAASVWSSLVATADEPGRPCLVPPPSTVNVEERPDLKVHVHRLAQAEARRRLAARVIEPPEISVGWLELKDAAQTFDGPVLGIAWPLPVFDRNQAARQAADAEQKKIGAELDTARLRAGQEARVALARYSELQGLVASADINGEELEIVEAVFAAFEVGETDLIDVLDTMRTAVAVQLARIETLQLALAAERQLEAALGRPMSPGGQS